MIGYIILAVVVLFVTLVTIRTLSFKPKAQPKISNEEISFDMLCSGYQLDVYVDLLRKAVVGREV